MRGVTLRSGNAIFLDSIGRETPTMRQAGRNSQWKGCILRHWPLELWSKVALLSFRLLLLFVVYAHFFSRLPVRCARRAFAFHTFSIYFRCQSQPFLNTSRFHFRLLHHRVVCLTSICSPLLPTHQQTQPTARTKHSGVPLSTRIFAPRCQGFLLRAPTSQRHEQDAQGFLAKLRVVRRETSQQGYCTVQLLSWSRAGLDPISEKVRDDLESDQ